MEFDNILQEFTLPIDFEIAVQLINLSPPIGESCYQIEWGLVHLVENLNTYELQKALDSSNDGEVKRIVQIRLNNYINELR